MTGAEPFPSRDAVHVHTGAPGDRNGFLVPVSDVPEFVAEIEQAAEEASDDE